MSRSSELIERLEPLLEMATILSKSCGFGIVIKIFSNDHNPPHMHVYDLDNFLLSKILIPTSKPNTVDDIEIYGSYYLSNKQKKTILMALNQHNSIVDSPNWKYAIAVWQSLHS